MMRAGWVLGNASGEVVLKVDMWPEDNQSEAEVCCQVLHPLGGTKSGVLQILHLLRNSG